MNEGDCLQVSIENIINFFDEDSDSRRHASSVFLRAKLKGERTQNP